MELLLLTTERLVLREYDISDQDGVHAYASDPEVVRFMPWGPNTPEETVHFIAMAIGYQVEDPRRNYEVAVELAAEHCLIGGCGIHVSQPEHRQGCIGYCLHPGYWGRGYATELADALLEFGFNRLGLHRIFALCDPRNVRSARVLEKVGMRREAHLVEDTLIRGTWQDSLLYATLDREWQRRTQTGHAG